MIHQEKNSSDANVNKKNISLFYFIVTFNYIFFTELKLQFSFGILRWEFPC